MADHPTLFDAPERPNLPLSDEELEVKAFVESLEADKPLTPAERVTARMCMALAKSIAEGNRKGRSVANDVERLMATMAALAGTDDNDHNDADDLTPAERELFDALASAPRNDPTEDGYAAQL